MEITKIVKPFIKKGVTQYFWQYSVYIYIYIYIGLDIHNYLFQYFSDACINATRVRTQEIICLWHVFIH